MTTSPNPASAEIVYLPLSKIVDHPHNVRSDLGDLTALITSIEASGVKLPIIVLPERTEAPHKGKHYLVDGHRRRAAAAKTKAKAPVPCLVQDLTEAEVIELMLIAGIQQADISPIDEARGYAMLVELDSTPASIAATVGRSVALVKSRLALLQLPTEILAHLEAGQINLEMAGELAKYSADTETMEWLVAELKAKRLHAHNLSWQARQHTDQREFDRALQSATDKARAAGVTIHTPKLDTYQRSIDPQTHASDWSPLKLNQPATLKAMELTAAQAKKHAGEPCHAVWIHRKGYQGSTVESTTVCTDPKRHTTKAVKANDSTIKIKPTLYAKRTNSGRAVPAPKLRKAMNAARIEHASAQLAKVPTITPDLMLIVLKALDERGGEARTKAAQLLGIAGSDAHAGYTAFEAFAADPANTNRAVLALALATCQLHDWSAGLHGTFLEWLTTTGYEPVDGEKPWLDEGLKALAKDRKDKADRLAKTAPKAAS